MKDILFQRLKELMSFRDGYNPLRGLAMPRLVSMLEEGERGNYAEIQWLYRMIEKRDATIRGVKRQLKSAINAIDWNIKIVDDEEQLAARGGTEADAAKQQQLLRTAYERIDNLRCALVFLQLADFRGFSHLEKHYDTEMNVTHLECVPQWHWVRDGLYGQWRYNAQARMGDKGVEIERPHFIIREVEDPANEILAALFLRKGMACKDWDGFLEVYGIPFLFLIGPPGASLAELDKFQAIAEQVIADARGMLPNGSDVKTSESGSKGASSVFSEHIKYQDEQMVLAGTSGLLTMLAESGSGTLAGGAHAATFARIAESEAAEISEIMQAQFDKPILEAAFGEGVPRLAYFQFATEDEEDVAQLADTAVKFHQAGFSMDAEELSEKSGFKLGPANADSEPEREPEKKKKGLKNRANGTDEPNPGEANTALLEKTLANAMGVTPFWLAPVRKRIQEIEKKILDKTVSDEDLAAFIQDAANSLPELLGEMDVEALANVIESGMGTAAIEGLTLAKRKQRKPRNAENR